MVTFLLIFNLNQLFYIYRDMIDYFNILAVIAFSIIFASHIDPLEHLKFKMGLGFNSKIYSEYKLVNLILKFLKKILNCAPCLSMWLTFFIFGIDFNSFKLGLIIYCITYFLSTKINQISL